ncbi:MAG: hypothetical protein HYV77_00055 [Candidatus Wildermuthbacteria bacterium]|nr:hypothetical protein [Candidatus Wildermuthbacteria bacterium]
MEENDNNLFLELHVPDFGKVKEFYGNLGFKVVYEEPVGEYLGYLVIKKGETRLNFYGGDARVYEHKFFKKFPGSTPRGYGVEAVVLVENVEEFYKSIFPYIQDCIVQPLELKRWGKKDFRIEDPFGFYIRFSEPMDWGAN